LSSAEQDNATSRTKNEIIFFIFLKNISRHIQLLKNILSKI